MNLNNKIEDAKIELLNEAIAKKKISKALALLKDEIVKLNSSEIAITEQVVILSKVLGIEIKLSTYKSWYYRNFEKKDKKVSAYPAVEKIAKNNVVQKSEPKEKISKIESHNKLVDDLNKTFERKTKQKFEGIL